MGIKEMQGTPASLEYIGPRGRKRKSKCIHYEKSFCSYTRAATYMGKCVGRMYCKYYNDEEEVTIELEEVAKERVLEKSRRNVDTKIHPYLYRKIILTSLENGKDKIIEIVKDEEKNPFKNQYSPVSQMGKELIGKETNDIINLNIGKRVVSFKIKIIK